MTPATDEPKNNDNCQLKKSASDPRTIKSSKLTALADVQMKRKSDSKTLTTRMVIINREFTTQSIWQHG